MALPKIIENIDARVKKSGDFMSGTLSIENQNNVSVFANDPQCAVIQSYPSGDWEHRRSFLLKDKDAGTLDSALSLGVLDDGSWKEYNILHGGNYNNYVPTFSGTGATGTWPISISGYAKAVKQQDTRSLNETPDTMQEGITLHLKNNIGSDGLNDGGTYHASIHVKDWGDYSGGPFGEIALTDNKNMWFRISQNQHSWDSWKKVVTTPEFSSPGIGMPDILALSLMNAGFGLYSDPEFSSGDNSVYIYNNSGNGTVSVTRTADSSCGNSTGYVMRIKHAGAASPGFGGFYQPYTARANAVFCQIFRAKIPVGYYLTTASNSMGADYRDDIITNRKGTGKWEWYVRLTLCGQSGTYSNGGHIYLKAYDGYASPSSSAPISWDISYCNVFDLTKGGSINAGMGTDYTTARARNISANTSGSPGSNGEIFIRY